MAVRVACLPPRRSLLPTGRFPAKISPSSSSLRCSFSATCLSSWACPGQGAGRGCKEGWGGGLANSSQLEGRAGRWVVRTPRQGQGQEREPWWSTAVAHTSSYGSLPGIGVCPYGLQVCCTA